MRQEYKQLPFLVCFLLLSFTITQEIQNIIFLSIGLFWNWAKESNSLREKSQTKKYSFSLVRFFFFYIDLFPKSKGSIQWFINILPASFFIGGISLLLESKAPFYYSFLGSLVFEVFYLCWKQWITKKVAN